MAMMLNNIGNERFHETAISIAGNSHLSTTDVVENEVQLVLGLEAVVESHQKRVVQVFQQHVPLRHDVFSLVPLDDHPFLEHLDGVAGALRTVMCQEHLSEAALADHSQKLEIARPGATGKNEVLVKQCAI